MTKEFLPLRYLGDREWLEGEVVSLLRNSSVHSGRLCDVFILAAAMGSRLALLALLEFLNREMGSLGDLLKTQILYRMDDLISMLDPAEIPYFEVEKVLGKLEERSNPVADDLWSSEVIPQVNWLREKISPK